MRRHPNRVFAALIGLGLSACTQPYLAPLGGQNGSTAALENSDRTNRLGRLSALSGVAAPAIEQLTAYPGQLPGLNQPLPVVRVVFDERSMFDVGSDRIRPGTGPALDILADSMRRDVPDAQLTLLGHTDAAGSDALNDDLSQRRARAVFQALVNRGVNAGQLSTVAIGRRQPIASNTTADGRARNRRVEFLISAAIEANMTVVAQRPIEAAYGTSYQAPKPAHVAAIRAGSVSRPTIFKTAVYTGPADISEASPNGSVHLQAAGALELGSPSSTK